MRTALAWFGGVFLVLVLAGVAVAVGGFYDVGADEPHSAVVERWLTWVRNRSIDVHTEQTQVPPLDSPELVKRGAREYAEMCVVCHLAPGTVDRTVHDALYPRPPDFTKVREDARAGFWAIKHGMKMSGMPAWGASHDDPTIWSIVAFLQKLPQLDESAYRALAGEAASEASMEEHHHHHDHPGEARSNTHNDD